MKTKLFKKTGPSIMLLVLALSFLLFPSQLLSNTDNNEVNSIKQNNNLQDSIITIVGEVVDLDHQPLEGVVVRDNGTTIEKLTDSEGKFELSLDTATVISFRKTGFYSVEHRVNKSDSSLVIILTPESNQLIVKGYGYPAIKNNDTEWFDLDTTSTLKQKYDLMKDSIESKSMKMDKWMDKMDTTSTKNRIHMHMNDSLKSVKKKDID